jgi:hypothetical protein
MNWKGSGGKLSWPNLRYYPGICLEELWKTTKTLIWQTLSLGPDLKMGPPEYKAGVIRKNIYSRENC